MELLIATLCFLGALVQATAGLGFGLVVAPLLLAVYEPVDAIQVAGALTLTIVALITPFIVKNILKPELGKLALGSLMGLVIGSICLQLVPIEVIRVAALVVLAYSLIRYVRTPLAATGYGASDTETERLGRGVCFGLVSGVMGATLAMPGPMALVFLREQRIAVAKVRATVFALMIGSYLGTLAISFSLHGVSAVAYEGLLTYLPPTLGGVVAGSVLARFIPAFLFDVATTLLMLSTLVVLTTKILTTHFF
ncbi:MAG: hypothetical protein CL583_13125 [Alteromonadaceae bacterium]|nr:hypothetical protein [Alteromonadaceae bacterium]|tara:strand:- start:905 stop:1660 length:756 start_codon:yes stop_codon:yes gene_type:complete